MPGLSGQPQQSQGYTQDRHKCGLKEKIQKERKERMTRGDQASVARPVTLFSEEGFIP